MGFTFPKPDLLLRIARVPVLLANDCPPDHHRLLISTFSGGPSCFGKIIDCSVVSWFLDSYLLPLFCVVAEAHLQKHSLQTAQNLLQEEVARAEEHSEVKLSSSPRVRRVFSWR